MVSNEAQADDGFVPFFRRYTKTWVHTVAAAGLTAFGTLTFVNRWFVVLAFASYLVPPIALYVRHSRRGTDLDSRPRSDTVSDSDAIAADHDRSPTTGRDRSSARVRDDPSPDARADSDSHARGEPTTQRSADPPTDTLGRDEVDGGALESETQADGTTDRDEDERPADEEAADSNTWNAVKTPTAVALTDVVVTETGAAYAVGSEGVVVADSGRTGWSALLEDGPAAGSNALHGVDATADGDAVWIAGDSGAVGRIDVDSGRHTDYTAPNDITDNWLGVAVGGSTDDETVLLINGSGAVVRGRYRGGDLEWDDPVKPGSGSSLSGVALADSAGYCCDTNDGVFATENGGESFERIGLDGADGTLEDVAAAGPGTCLVSADDGVVHRFDGSTWTPERVADEALPGLASRGERTVACAADGTIYERTADATSWEAADTDASDSLRSVSIGPERSVAVGDGGTVLERS